MSLQRVSVVETYFDIGSGSDWVTAECSPPQACDALLRLAAHGEHQIQQLGGLLLTGRECRILKGDQRWRQQQASGEVAGNKS